MARAEAVSVWTNMIPFPSYGSTLAQRQAIGALCMDVSVALNMTYRATGSGAWTSSDAFVSTFGYGHVVHCWTSNNLVPP